MHIMYETRARTLQYKTIFEEMSYARLTYSRVIGRRSN